MSESKEALIIRRIQTSLLGVQLGDAIGMPVEMMSPGEIKTATGGRGVTGPMPPVQRKIKDTRGLKAGETTDDWQLTRVVAESLIAMRDYDQHDMAMRHISAFLGDNRGWGGTTKKGIQSLIDGRSPHELMPIPEPGKGCGNGVAMKIAPIALFYGARYGRFKRQPLMDTVMEHAKLTHPDIRAAIAAYALAAGIMKVMHEPLQVMRDDDKVLKQQKAFLNFVIDEAVAAEEEYNDTSDLEDSVSWRIDQAMQLMHDRVKMRCLVRTGCIAIESVPFALATFARRFESLHDGILEAVNAGGDTDSTASMVGALTGANYSDYGAFRDQMGVLLTWKEALEDEGAEAQKLGKKLYEASRP